MAEQLFSLPIGLKAAGHLNVRPDLGIILVGYVRYPNKYTVKSLQFVLTEFADEAAESGALPFSILVNLSPSFFKTNAVGTIIKM